MKIHSSFLLSMDESSAHRACFFSLLCILTEQTADSVLAAIQTAGLELEDSTVELEQLTAQLEEYTQGLVVVQCELFDIFLVQSASAFGEFADTFESFGLSLGDISTAPTQFIIPSPSIAVPAPAPAPLSVPTPAPVPVSPPPFSPPPLIIPDVIVRIVPAPDSDVYEVGVLGMFLSSGCLFF